MSVFGQLDRVLRGDALKPGDTGRRLDFAVGPLLGLVAILAASYGVCMGSFAVLARDDPEWRQILASAVKVPLLFVLTLVVTFPSLYVFSALLGSRLRLADLLRVVSAGLAVLVTVLAAFGPIVSFFSVSTTSYPFILLLNVVVFAAAGGFGVTYLYRAVVRTSTDPRPEDEAPDDETDERDKRAARRERERGTRRVFLIWVLVFGLVGAQSGWILRPFVGSPDVPFTWFRPKQGSFFEGVGASLRLLFSGPIR
jgi:hypothetical protein